LPKKGSKQTPIAMGFLGIESRVRFTCFIADLSVASTLRIPGLLMWSQSANVSDYAIATVFLKFAGPTALADKHALLEKAMDKETLKLLQLMAERRSSLVTHIFKNLASK